MMIVIHIAPRPVFMAWNAKENWMTANRTYRTRIGLLCCWACMRVRIIRSGARQTVNFVTIRPPLLPLDRPAYFFPGLRVRFELRPDGIQRLLPYPPGCKSRG